VIEAITAIASVLKKYPVVVGIVMSAPYVPCVANRILWVAKN